MPRLKLHLQRVDFGEGGDASRGMETGDVALWFSGSSSALYAASKAIPEKVNGVGVSLYAPARRKGGLLKVKHSCVARRDDPGTLEHRDMLGAALRMLEACGAVAEVDLGIEVVPQPLYHQGEGESEGRWFPGALMKLRDNGADPFPPDMTFREVAANVVSDKLDHAEGRMGSAGIANLEGGVHTEMRFAATGDASAPEHYVTARFLQSTPCSGQEEARQKSKQAAETVAGIIQCAQARAAHQTR